MGLQNFPEGAAVSLPMRSQGVGAGKAFWCGAASGVVEPVFGLLTVLVAGSIGGVMPWILSFAAGAMLYVVVEELIPEAQLGEHSPGPHVMTAFCSWILLEAGSGKRREKNNRRRAKHRRGVFIGFESERAARGP